MLGVIVHVQSEDMSIHFGHGSFENGVVSSVVASITTVLLLLSGGVTPAGVELPSFGVLELIFKINTSILF